MFTNFHFLKIFIQSPLETRKLFESITEEFPNFDNLSKLISKIFILCYIRRFDWICGKQFQVFPYWVSVRENLKISSSTQQLSPSGDKEIFSGKVKLWFVDDFPLN